MHPATEKQKALLAKFGIDRDMDAREARDTITSLIRRYTPERCGALEAVANAARELTIEDPYEFNHSVRCDLNTENRTTGPCQCGTDDWIEATKALTLALLRLYK